MGERLNPSKNGFESKEAPKDITGKNATKSLSNGPESGAGQVGNKESNPYGPGNANSPSGDGNYK